MRVVKTFCEIKLPKEHMEYKLHEIATDTTVAVPFFQNKCRESKKHASL